MYVYFLDCNDVYLYAVLPHVFVCLSQVFSIGLHGKASCAKTAEQCPRNIHVYYMGFRSPMGRDRSDRENT